MRRCNRFRAHPSVGRDAGYGVALVGHGDANGPMVDGGVGEGGPGVGDSNILERRGARCIVLLTHVKEAGFWPVAGLWSAA